MEVLLVGAIVGAGYFFKNNVPSIAGPPLAINKNDLPNGPNIYESNRVNEINRDLLKQSSQLYKLAENPADTGIIPPYFGSPVGNSSVIQSGSQLQVPTKLGDSRQTIPSVMPIEARPMFKYGNVGTMRSEFTEINAPAVNLVSGEPFKHNNMSPFFGSSIKQNVETFATTSILEKLSGVDPLYKNKDEVQINPINGKENIYGNPAFTAVVSTDRFIPGRFRQGEKLMQDQHIAAPIANTIDNNIRPVYKSIEELEVNPKESYLNTPNEGQKGSYRGIEPDYNKNNVNTFYENQNQSGNPFANINNSTEQFNYQDTFKNPHREHQDYSGNINSNALNKTMQGLTKCNDTSDNSDTIAPSCEREPHRSTYKNSHITNASKIGSVNDYGKSDTQYKSTERITTNFDTFTGNALTGNKKGTVGLQDNVKTTIKQTTLVTDNSGNVKTQYNQGVSEATSQGINNQEVKTTLKQDLSIITNKYLANATKNEGLGYLVNNIDVKTTFKDTINKRDRINGPSRSNVVNGKENTYTNPIRSNNAMDLINTENNREELNPFFIPKISTNVQLGSNNRQTDNQLDIDNRFQPQLFDTQLNDNPYHISRPFT
jgi:hypothetical protein